MHALVTTEFNEAQRIKVKAFQDEGGICQYLGEGSMEGEETKGVRTDRAVCKQTKRRLRCLFPTTLFLPLEGALSSPSLQM